MGYANVSHEMDSDLNISPKMSYGVIACGIVVIELHTYDFLIKRGIICARPCMFHYISTAIYVHIFFKCLKVFIVSVFRLLSSNFRISVHLGFLSISCLQSSTFLFFHLSIFMCPWTL